MKLYRYVSEYRSEDTSAGFRLYEYNVIRQTESSFFIEGTFKGIKRVPKKAQNAWAHSTKERAFEHLRGRLKTRIKWYAYWKENCQLTLQVMEKVGVVDFADEYDLSK